MRVAHNFPAVVHDELYGDVSQTLQHVLHGEYENVDHGWDINSLRKTRGRSAYNSQGGDQKIALRDVTLQVDTGILPVCHVNF